MIAHVGFARRPHFPTSAFVSTRWHERVCRCPRSGGGTACPMSSPPPPRFEVVSLVTNPQSLLRIHFAVTEVNSAKWVVRGEQFLASETAVAKRSVEPAYAQSHRPETNVPLDCSFNSELSRNWLRRVGSTHFAPPQHPLSSRERSPRRDNLVQRQRSPELRCGQRPRASGRRKCNR